jgi:hypothetical protein
MAPRVYICFDYDNDLDLKNLLVGQSKNPHSRSPTGPSRSRRPTGRRKRASESVESIKSL